MNNADIVALVRREIEASQGYDADVLATKRELALDYYNGAMVAAPEGRSQIVSHDVADTVHALLAQIMPVFQSSIIEFAPQSEEDEPQAQLESDFVRWQLEQSDGYKILSEAAHDALLIANGWIKVTVEEKAEVGSESYSDLSAMQLQFVSQPRQEGEEVKVTEKGGTYTIKRTMTTRELKVDCISPDVMLFSTSADQFDFEELRFVGERVLYTSTELKEMGVSKSDIASIEISHDDYWPAIRAREGIYQDRNEQELGGSQDAEQLRECYDVFMRIDLNDSGSSELRHLRIGGSVLILNEPAECIPYATGSPVPMPHRVQGTGMFELMHQIQDSKTHTLRQYMDNLAVMNGSRIGAVEGQVNMDDLTNGRINGVVRMRSPDAILPLPAADIGQQAIAGLNYLDSQRSQRGGASVELGDADRQLMQSSAMAAGAAVDSSEKMAGWYCTNLVNTLLANTYKLIHKRLRYDMPGEVGAKLRGKWSKTDPAQWQERKHMNVTAGMTTSERNRKKQDLMMVMQQQQMAMQNGGMGVITDMSKIYNASADLVRLMDVGAPEEYLIDPNSQEAQQAGQQQSQQQQQQQAKADKMQEEILAIEQGKIAQDKYQVDKELEFKYFDSRLDAEIKEAEITTDAILETEKNANVQQNTDNRVN